jgi:periplasmic divalent cation tolerance protein
MSDQVILALTGCPDRGMGPAIASALVQERLATCMNRIGGVRSTCFWDARLRDQAEILLIMSGNERYLDWVRMGVQRKGE